MSQIALWIRLYSKDVKRRAIVMWKKVIAVVMMIGIMGGTDIRALASEESSVKELQTNERDSGISIMTLNTAKQNNKLLISSTHVATVYCYIAGTRDVTKTSISATLQKKVGSSWTNVKTWTSTTSTNKTSLRKTKNVVSGSSYRVKATFKAYKGKSCETKITYSTVKKG